MIDTGKHDSRLQFFESWPQLRRTELYQSVFKHLLSIRTEGSISVERVAKPLKNKVLTKERNRLGTGRAELLLRAGLNLNFIRAAKQDLKIA